MKVPDFIKWAESMQKEEKKDLTQNQIYDIIAQLNTN